MLQTACPTETDSMRTRATTARDSTAAADLQNILAGVADLIAAKVAESLGAVIKAREQAPSTRGKAPDFVSEQDLSKRTGVSRRTLQGWRAKGKPPRWVKLGSRVLYDARAVDELLRK
jgi:NAD/NADP transhydrogenase alpha subunit